MIYVRIHIEFGNCKIISTGGGDLAIFKYETFCAIAVGITAKGHFFAGWGGRIVRQLALAKQLRC